MKTNIKRVVSSQWRVVLLAALFSIHYSLLAVTPFSYQFFNADGTAQTNPITMEAWPRATNGWTVYGTNIVFGSKIITLTPGTNGAGTNLGAFPNTYRLWVSNLNSGFYISLPDNPTQQVSLGSCVISAPQTAGPIGLFGMVTNWLGYMPIASNSTALITGLGYTPATNGLAALTNYLTDTALVGIHGYRPATNGLGALTNYLTDTALVGIHGYRPATNGLGALTNVLGFTPVQLTYANITNALGFKPPTNPAIALTAVVPIIIPGSVTNQLYITNGFITKTNWP